jgi:drug/metabolite transporter (DMT)-like permease
MSTPASTPPSQPARPFPVSAAQSRAVRRAYLLLAAVVVLWGVNWPVMKIGLAYIDPVWFVVIRMFFGAALFFGWQFATSGVAVPGRRDVPIILSIGLLQIGLYLVLITVGLRYVPAGRSAILSYTTPLWVVPGALLLGERLTASRLGGLALGLAGMAVLFEPGEIDWSDRGILFGNLCLVFAAFAWAIAILHIRFHRWQLSPLQLMPWHLLLAGVAVLPLALAVEGAPHIEWTPEFWAVLLYNGPLTTCFCVWAIITIGRILPAITTSLVLLAVPVVGLAASTLWLGEALTGGLLLGMALIGAGVGLVSLADRGRN